MYDLNGDPVEKVDRLPFFGLVVSLLVLVGLAAVILTSNDPPEIRHDSLDATLTQDGTHVSWYVFIDPDTGVEYLVNDRGGCTQRLDKNGEQMVISS